MGAYTQVLAFDLERYRQEGVPALQEKLDQHSPDLRTLCHRLDRDWGVAHSQLSELACIHPFHQGGVIPTNVKLAATVPFTQEPRADSTQNSSCAPASVWSERIVSPRPSLSIWAKICSFIRWPGGMAMKWGWNTMRPSRLF